MPVNRGGGGGGGQSHIPSFTPNRNYRPIKIPSDSGIVGGGGGSHVGVGLLNPLLVGGGSGQGRKKLSLEKNPFLQLHDKRATIMKRRRLLYALTGYLID